MMSGNGMGPSGNGITAASGYRVSMVSGGLEVSARLSNLEELELLVNVLEANKALWSNPARGTLGPQSRPKATLEFLDGAASQKAGTASTKAPV